VAGWARGNECGAGWWRTGSFSAFSL